MPAKTLVDALDATTTALLDVARFTDDEALRVEALNAFDRFMLVTEQLKPPHLERVRRHENAKFGSPSAEIIQMTLANGKAL